MENHLEAAMVVESRIGDEGGRQLDNFVETAEIENCGRLTSEQAQAAHLAWRRYGKEQSSRFA